MSEALEISVEEIPESGQCGDVGDEGGSLPGLDFSDETGCEQSAEYQVFAVTEPPEATHIASACEEHVEEARQVIAELEG